MTFSACRRISQRCRRFWSKSPRRPTRLSAVAGITTSTDPGEPAKAVRTRADKIQKLAKDSRSRGAPDRFGALAIEGQDAIERIEIEETTAVRSDAI
jgi:hypothetical protein